MSANQKNDNDSTELAQLEHYAKATQTKVLTSTADIDLKDHVLPEMYSWCNERGNTVVLRSGSILSSAPISREIQNCKSVMLSKGIPPGRVFAATKSLISLLLANSENEKSGTLRNKQKIDISDRQQHLRNIVQEAINNRASDIHIEVRTVICRVRLRINGELHVYAEWSSQLGREIAAVAFNKETDHATSHFNPYIPQDASMPLNIQGRKVRLRLASMPAHGGFDMVMRILATSEHEEANVKLTDLGYTQAQLNIISQAIKQPHGAILVAGPTGSGKTTTLASCMKMVDEVRKIYSIEDPVEKVVETATQVPVNTDKDNRSFASMGRAALRMDPDVIVLGEMRDEDTAQVMVRAAITGHLVLTTVHTSSATGIVTRLLDLGISSTLLSDSSLFRVLMFQRLITRLCDHCSKPIAESDYDLPYWTSIVGDLSQVRVRNRSGCAHCNKKGVSGRTVAAEVIWVDENGRAFIKTGDTVGWERYLREQGWKTYSDHAIELIRIGRCDPVDTEKTLGLLVDSSKIDGFNYRDVA